MATYIYCDPEATRRPARRVTVTESFYRPGYTREVSRVNYLRNGFVQCAECNYPGPAIEINATQSDTPCSKRCTLATRPDCECDCNGLNHGSAA